MAIGTETAGRVRVGGAGRAASWAGKLWLGAGMAEERVLEALRRRDETGREVGREVSRGRALHQGKGGYKAGDSAWSPLTSL